MNPLRPAVATLVVVLPLLLSLVTAVPAHAQTAPTTPANMVPLDGATGVTLKPTLSATAFNDVDAGDLHAASQWQVRQAAAAPDYSATVYDSGPDGANLTDLTVPGSILDLSTTYFWRVRYRDNEDLWSAWSSETSFTTGNHPASLTFLVKETLPVDATGYDRLAGVGNLDDDGALDAVLWTVGGSSYRVVERQGGGWVERQTYAESPTRTMAVGDVDGDGRPEILSANSTTATIREGVSDNVYGVIHTEVYGNYIEMPTAIGDSNDNGNLEFLIGQETSPSNVHILESTANDTYTDLGSVSGTQVNCAVTGVADVDQDTLPELIFHDSPSAPGGPMTTHIFENGASIGTIPTFAARWLGDTDGNGLPEIIGQTLPGTTNDLRIFEGNGNNSYTEVWNVGQPYTPVDLDGDGRTELMEIVPGDSGFDNVIRVNVRSGVTVAEIWASNDLLQDANADITSVLPIGDADGNGAAEVAVLHGQSLRILELAHTVLFQTDGTAGAGLSGDLEQAVSHDGTTTSVTVFPPIGYDFVQWTESGAPFSTANPLVLSNVTDDLTLVATFAPNGQPVPVLATREIVVAVVVMLSLCASLLLRRRNGAHSE